MVFNPLNIAREDMVEANVDFPERHSKGSARHLIRREGKSRRRSKAARFSLWRKPLPSVMPVYDVQPAETASVAFDLKVTDSSLENDRYRVQLDQNGDVSSIYDKALNKELLSAPIRLAISTDIPKIYPAWNMEFDQEQAAPRAYVSGPAKIRIKENGPVRVSLEVTRETEGSKFVQTISLSAGDAGNRVEFGNAIDWKTLAANLKATSRSAASNENATYNWDIGTIQAAQCARSASSKSPRIAGSISPTRAAASAPPF